MDYKKIKNGTLFSAAAGAVIYSIVTGKGPFNKLRFKEQHEVLADYVDNNYPDCFYSPITIHGNGWCSSVRRGFTTLTYIYFSKSADGVYVFTESKQKLN